MKKQKDAETLPAQSEAEIDAQAEAILSGNGGEGKFRRKKGIKKFIIPVVVAGVVIFAVMKMTGGNKTYTPMVSAEPLSKGSIVQTLSLSGPVSGTDSVDVVSNLHAEIIDIKVKEGDKVEKGQVIAILDTTDLEKQIQIAQNAYDLAMATYNDRIKETKAANAKAVADFNTAKANLERTQALYDGGSASLVELETAQNAYNDAERQMNTQAGTQSYALQAESAKLELEQKQELLEDAEIKSPISGTVVRVNCKVGRFADKTEDDKPMFIIENLDVLEMKINVSEYSIGEVQIGQKANITADILNGEQVAGEVVDISPTGEEKGGGSTERVIPITVRISEANSKLIAGITAKAQIIMKQSDDTFVIPSANIMQQADGSLCVAAVADGTIKLIGVETGVENDFEVEIFPKEGFTLEEGMMIISNPSAGLTEGMAVAVLPSAS